MPKDSSPTVIIIFIKDFEIKFYNNFFKSKNRFKQDQTSQIYNYNQMQFNKLQI